MPPQLGHGPDRFPEKEMCIEFSTKNPELKTVPQVSQKAGTDGMRGSYCDAQRNVDGKARLIHPGRTATSF
jgi:hypothetical protein